MRAASRRPPRCSAERFDHIFYTGNGTRRPRRHDRGRASTSRRSPSSSAARARPSSPPTPTWTSPPGASPGASSSTPARPASRPTTCSSTASVRAAPGRRARRGGRATSTARDPQASRRLRPHRQRPPLRPPRRPARRRWLRHGRRAAAGTTGPRATSRRRCSPGSTPAPRSWARRSSARSCRCSPVDDVDEAIAFVNERRQAAGALRLHRRRRRHDEGASSAPRPAACASTTPCSTSPCPTCPSAASARAAWARTTARPASTRFSHRKSVLAKPTRPDPSVLYPPYSRIKRWLIRRAM